MDTSIFYNNCFTRWFFRTCVGRKICNFLVVIHVSLKEFSEKVNTYFTGLTTKQYIFATEFKPDVITYTEFVARLKRRKNKINCNFSRKRRFLQKLKKNQTL